MGKQTIGKLEYNLRKKRKISVKDLCRGICNETVIYRFESNEYMPDYLMVERIFSRLGKSSNKVEGLLSKDEYQIYCIQRDIENALEKELYKEVEWLLEIYDKAIKADSLLHMQYKLKVKSILASVQGEHLKAASLVEQAILATVPEFSMESGEFFLLSEDEIQLILMWINEKKLQNMNIEEEISYIMNYIEGMSLDEEILVSIYPKAMGLYIGILEEKGDYLTAYQLCEKVMDMLILNGILLNIPYFLRVQRVLAKKLGKEKEAYILKKKEEAVKWIFNSYGKKYSQYKVNFWKKYYKRKIYLLSEQIKEGRQENVYTQEDIAEEIQVDVKTISRIETGMCLPKKVTFEKLRKKSILKRDYFETMLKVDDFETLELERKICRELELRNYKYARILLEEMKSQLKKDESVNMQYYLYMTVILDVMEKKIGKEEAITKCLQAFEYTRCFDVDSFRQIVLNEKEIVIINFIAKLYRETGREEVAIQLLESVLAGFSNSGVKESEHFKELVLPLGSLACYCETSNQLEKALQYEERAINMILECGRGDNLGNAMLQKVYIQERMGRDKLLCKEDYKKVYLICDLFKMKHDVDSLAAYYRNAYGESIKECEIVTQ